MRTYSSRLDVSKFKKDFIHLYRKRHELIDEDAPILNDIVEKITSVNYSIVAFLKSVDSIEDAHIQKYCRCAAIAQLFNAHLDYRSGYPYIETSANAKEIILIQCKQGTAFVSKYGDIIIDEGKVSTHRGANFGLGFIVHGILTQHYGFIANNGAMILPCVFDGFDPHIREINPIYNNGCFSVRIYGNIHSIDKEKLQEIIDNYDDDYDDWRTLYCISNDILFAICPGWGGDRYSKGNIADLKPLLSQLLVSKEDLQNIQL